MREIYAQLENATFGGSGLAVLKLFEEPLKNADNRGILTRLKRASDKGTHKRPKQKAYFNCVNAESVLHLRVFFHDGSCKFQDRVFVTPGNQSTFLVDFSLVRNLLPIDVHEMRSKISLIWR